VRTGLLRRPHRDVFVLAGATGVGAQDWAALLASGGGAVQGGWTAARRHGWTWQPGLPQPPCIAVPPQRHLHLQGVRLLRWHLPAEHVRTLDDGTDVTVPARTVVDCLRLAPAVHREQMLDTALLRRWVSVAGLCALVADLRGRPGVRMLDDLVAGVDSGARSRAERLAQQVLGRTGLPGWQWNHRVALPDGGVAVVDAALPHLRIAVEIDGRAYHSDPATFQRDRTRQNALVAAGWTVLRFTWADLTQRADAVVAAVLAAAARAS
jgi:very-short-patch-repair endonuclease